MLAPHTWRHWRRRGHWWGYRWWPHWRGAFAPLTRAHLTVASRLPTGPAVGSDTGHRVCRVIPRRQR